MQRIKLPRFAILSIAVLSLGCLDKPSEPIYGNPWDPDSPYPPRSPIELTATMFSASEVLLEWTDMSGNEEGFLIEQSIGNNQNFALLRNTSANDTTASIPGLLPSTLYYYRVCGTNRFGSSLFTNEVSIQVAQRIPNAPTALRAISLSPSRIDLSWQDNSTNEDRFNIYRFESPDSIWQMLSSVNCDTTNFSDFSLTPRTRYSYRVTANNDSGSSNFSNIATAATSDIAPAAPTGLRAGTLTSNRIRLHWSDNSDNEEGFVLERKLGLGGNWDGLDSVWYNDSTYIDTSLLIDTVYFYRVHAYNAVARSESSNEAMISTSRTPPEAPTNLEGNAVSPELVDLHWNDRSSNELGFGIERRVGLQGIWELATSIEPNSTFHRLIGNQPGSTYQFRVRAFNSYGESGFTNTVTIQTPDRLPAVPTNLVAEAVSPHQINLTWSDNSDNEDWFEVMRHGEGNQDWQLIGRTGAGVASLVDQGLQPNSFFTYKVAAGNENGTSDYSSESAARTSTGLPASPGDLTARSLTPRSIELNWEDHSINEDWFEIYRMSELDSVWRIIERLSENTISFLNSGLTPNMRYVFKISASNTYGSSQYSNEVTERTPPIAPEAPSNLIASIDSMRHVYLEWRDNSEMEEGFLIERKEAEQEYEILDSLDSNTTSFLDTTLSAMRTYFYRINAYNSAGRSDYSNEAEINPPFVGVAALICLDDDGLWAIDVTNPTDPELISDGNPLAYRVAIYGSIAYSRWGNGIYVTDIANLRNRRLLNYHRFDGDPAIAIRDAYLYLVRGNRFEILSLNVPAQPALVGFSNENQYESFRNISISQGYAYVACNERGLIVANVESPESPRYVQQAQFGRNVINVQAVEQYAYITTSDSGFRSLDISDPSNPRLMGDCNRNLGSQLSILVRGEFAYVAAGSDGLRIISISNPSAPHEVGFINLGGSAETLDIFGDYAYVIGYNIGLRCIDISNPISPFEVGRMDLPGAQDIKVLEYR